ncbi:MAG TPA: type II toxin-antitoxin system PemK/MazF family toxin [Thermoanaerobaculia bacterium]|nr:type II toxin-antitoxin system PemK/MazF family toxin [Thermoanaerobaculia bacterium]
MTEGDVALAVLPQVDQRAKRRPVLVLRQMPGHQDVLVCGISTQLQHRIIGFDEVISPGDLDFKQSGLLTESLIRLGFLAVLPPGRIAGSIGTVSPERHRRLLKALARYLTGDFG